VADIPLNLIKTAVRVSNKTLPWAPSPSRNNNKMIATKLREYLTKS
jgi:hypothetical protein